MPTLTSADGTTIAFTIDGSGPATVLVGGALDDGSENAALIPALADRFTVYNYARRGRGASGDTPPHTLAREIEDLDALVAFAGGTAHLFGSSSGGALALEAAAAGTVAGRIAIYDPPYSVTDDALSRWQTYVRDLHGALAADDRHQAVTLFMQVAGLPDEAIAGAQASPFWPHLVESAHTLAYDATCLNDGSPPRDRLARVAQPVLVMTGQSQDEVMTKAEPGFFARAADTVADLLPNAERRVVAAGGHAVDADAIAPALLEFFGSRLMTPVNVVENHERRHAHCPASSAPPRFRTATRA